MDPFDPQSPDWQRSLMDPQRCWVQADDEAEARAILTAYAYEVRPIEPDGPPIELLQWTVLALCELDETVQVPAGTILTGSGQRLPMKPSKIAGI